MSEAAVATKTPAKRRPFGVWIIFGLALLCNALTWGLVLWKLPPTESTVFLHYNIYFGIDLAGSWYQLLWIPGSGTAIFGINLAVVLLSKGLEHFFRVIGATITLLVELMILLASVLVVLLNG